MRGFFGTEPNMGTIIPYSGMTTKGVPTEAEQRGGTQGGTPLRARCSPLTTSELHCFRSAGAEARPKASGTTSVGRAACRPAATGGDLRRQPTHSRRYTPPGVMTWRERPREMAAWLPRPRPHRRRGRSRHSVTVSTREVGHGPIACPLVEHARILVVDSSRRVVIVRLATRALKALRTAVVPLRPRGARLTALTARVAIRSEATIDG